MTRTSNVTALERLDDGSFGYVLNGILYWMYCPSMTARKAPCVTISEEEGIESGFNKWGFSIQLANDRNISVKLPYLLFSCEWQPEDSDLAVFIQKPWPIATESAIIVRALYPEALWGHGALVRSNLNRVYVVDETLPRHSREGYLAVKGLAIVRSGTFTLSSYM